MADSCPSSKGIEVTLRCPHVVVGDSAATHSPKPQHLPRAIDVEYLAACAVLDALHARLMVLVDQGDSIALADGVVDARQLDLKLTQLATRSAVVLRPRVQPVDLPV
jgi:hypothetical protein